MRRRSCSAPDVEDSSLRVEVQDQVEGGVEVHDPQPDDEDGRGLQLVDVLADKWGCVPDRRGKQVWFVLGTLRL